MELLSEELRLQLPPIYAQEANYDPMVYALCCAQHNAEDFKQGAKIHEAPVRRAGAWALCLKFCCAKPLQNASSYVFWKITVSERRPGEYRRLEGMRWEKRGGCVLQ